MKAQGARYRGKVKLNDVILRLDRRTWKARQNPKTGFCGPAAE